MRTTLGALALLVFSILAAGCGTLPDAKPFADASSTLAVAVKSSGQALGDSLRDAGSAATPADAKDYEELVSKFEAAWAERVKAVQGVAAYSEAIADLIDAGKEGEETVKKVGDSLQGLASAVGIPLAGPAVGVASSIAESVAKRIALVRASRKLEDALAQAQPAVDGIAEHLVDDAEKRLKPILRDAHKNLVNSIKSPYDADDNFAKSFAKQRDELRQKALKDSKLVPQLSEFERVQAAAVASLKERDQKVEQATAAYRARLQLVAALSPATTAWAGAHRDLAAAVREKRKVTATELAETVVELRELAKKVRAL